MNFKDLAKETREISDRIGNNLDAHLNKLTQEVGEFNDAVQKYRGIFCKQKAENLDSAKDEFGDVLFNLIYIADRIGIDVNKSLEYAENTLKKYKEREQVYIQNKK